MDTENTLKSEDATTVSDYKIGAFHEGSKVTAIFSRGRDYVIFKTERSKYVRLRYWDLSYSKFIARLEKIVYLATTRFRGERYEEINPLITLTARRIFENCSEEELVQLLGELTHEINAIPEVRIIIGRAERYAVWQNSDETISYRINNKTAETEQAIVQFSRIHALASTLLPEKKLGSFNRRLGAALYVALNPGENSSEIFNAVERLALGSMQNQIKLRLLIITVGVAIILMFAMTYTYYYISLPRFIELGLISATGGVAGALISFLERSKKSNVTEGDQDYLIVLSNVARVLIGGLFGLIAFSAANADLAFSLFKSTKPALLILGVAAGFSERLIPDVLGTIASNKNNEAQK